MRILRLRRAYQFGWRVEADTFRAKRLHLREVASFPPLSCGTGPIDCFMLLDEARIWEGLWSLYSFRLHVGSCRLTVLSDGTLSGRSMSLLRTLLPGIRIPAVDDNDTETLAYLSARGLRRCCQWRERFLFFRKLIDPFRLATTRAMVLLDSDCLHFGRPDDVLAWAEQPAHTRYVADVHAHSFCVTPEAFRAISGADAPPHFCAGYLCIPSDAVDFARIESYLSHEAFEAQLRTGRFSHVAEQTLVAMESAILGAAVLPPAYLPCPAVPVDGVVFGHFCGGTPSRTWFYTKGLPLVSRQVQAAASAAFDTA